ncbi:hypothetical protein S1OALGB6SA_1242 [Olavius algarvensis spirochete endosymbiont]|uniref:LysM peptidoglycan-binding domain-containing protein n=1 Tax=Olavius algarvensis spirochete endosymbiont TaxID=260710 RepID=UPI000F25F8D8|nr:LysM peptidoglycan-binding domain-containing protein [Olavius algarvensis spirochete endosymbiont]CAD7845619.1 MAG: hypothetical protein [Olavius algarvensis spirochete endosymbiont]VDB00167.1 hypothetical protein S1OALGB6SA_1242 [Olavius algarvensis spirochete endosymbiont]
MRKSHQMGLLFVATSIIALLGLVSCETRPPEPKEEVVVEEPADVQEPQEPQEPIEVVEEPVKPLSDEEIKAAMAAVQRANLIGASRYLPTDYQSLVDKLNSTINLGDSDPDTARIQLQNLIDEADSLYDRTIIVRRDEYAAKYFRADAALLNIEAEKFAPAEYLNTQKLALETTEHYKAGDTTSAIAKADETISAQARLYYNLAENIRYIDILKRDTKNYLSDAEDNEAFVYAPEELDEANRLYERGLNMYDNYSIEASAAILTEAKQQSVIAARISAIKREQSETDSLLTLVQGRIETASTRSAMDSEGNVIEPSPWEGNAYIDANPLVDLSQNVEPVDIEEAMLRDLDEPLRNELDGVPEDILIEEEGTQVNADEQTADYLALAKKLWEQGVIARNKGEFDIAKDYFEQANAYVNIFESNLVSRTYTVVYREVATDCLWRIAERVEIFDNPFMWPKIWRANRKIIQNPDLVYPGQVLIIPPR